VSQFGVAPAGGVGPLLRLGVGMSRGESSAEELVALLRGGAAERESAIAELFRLEAEHNAGSSGGAESLAEIAVACASPLCEVLSRPVSEVDAEAYRRAALVLTAISGVDPARVGAEMFKLEQCNLWGWAAPDSALAVVLAKEPASLTPDDALVLAGVMAPLAIQWSTQESANSCAGVAGVAMADVLTAFLPLCFMVTTRTPSDDLNMALLPLLLELLEAPEQLQEFALVGVLCTLHISVQGRPAVAARALELGILAALMRCMQQVSA